MTDFYSENIGYEPKVNFDDFNNVHVEIKNGSPELINEVEAIRQWIVKFVLTEKDAYEIYEGTGFGNRIKQLFGNKRIGLGYEEAEIERDFREGLPLCPAISQVTNFELQKQGKNLHVDIGVELFNGELVTISIKKVYTIKY